MVRTVSIDCVRLWMVLFFFFQAEDGIRDYKVTGVQTCALPISSAAELREIYRPILDRTFRCPVHNGTCPPGPKAEFLVTTISSAELIKHASNSDRKSVV